MSRRVCYIRGLAKGATFVIAGQETNKEYRFTFLEPCIDISPDGVDERDVYGLLQHVKRELGSCGCQSGNKQQKEKVYQTFALRN